MFPQNGRVTSQIIPDNRRNYSGFADRLVGVIRQLIVLSEKHLCFIDLISIHYDDNVDLPEKVDHQHYVFLMYMFYLLKPMQNDT
jgi:hypothetical protein